MKKSIVVMSLLFTLMSVSSSPAKGMLNVVESKAFIYFVVAPPLVVNEGLHRVGIAIANGPIRSLTVFGLAYTPYAVFMAAAVNKLKIFWKSSSLEEENSEPISNSSAF